MKKLYIFLIIVAIVVLAGAGLFFWAFEVKEDRIMVRDENQPLLKNIARKINDIIYDEATKHNPQGDLLPDQLDDAVKEKIKESL